MLSWRFGLVVFRKPSTGFRAFPGNTYVLPPTIYYVLPSTILLIYQAQKFTNTLKTVTSLVEFSILNLTILGVTRFGWQAMEAFFRLLVVSVGV